MAPTHRYIRNGRSIIEFIYANSLNLGDEARNLAIGKAQAALKAAIAH